jgi:type II secretory pathway component GspD/PulD (secretin)/tetratricopeptide (TPR) repeat protein
MGMGVLLGATLSPWAATASVPVAVLTNVTAAEAPAQQSESRLTRAHSALNAAIDSQRQGRYEQADILFREAQAHQEDLTADERQDLAGRMKANTAALLARREGDEQLKQAETAYKAGKTGEAEGLLKKVIANSSVTPDNRKKAMQLAGQIRPRGTDNSSVVSNALPLARAKVQQARAMLNRFDIDGAEQLAMEAKKLGAPFTSAEDTPDKVISDVGQLRSDPKALLAAARNACERGDYDHAEQYAKMADKKESAWTMHLRGDSPSKVLKDAQAGRARMAQSGQKPVTAQTQKPMDSTATTGDTAATQQKADTKPVAKPTTELTNVTSPHASKPEMKSETTTTKSPVKEDAATLMMQAKDAMAAGKLDEASKLAYRAKAAQTPRSGWGASWQLFEETPDKLIKEINRAKAQRDQEESWKVLAEGRKLLEAGRLEEASKCAYRAETLHGPYSIMELGDRPHKLQADVQTALEKRRKSGAPVQTAAKTPTEVQSPKTNPPATPGTPLMKDKPVETAGATGPDIGSPYAGVHNAGGGPKPAGPAVSPALPAVDLNKVKAQAMLADARQLQKEGRLIEAHQKALECQKLGVTFGLDEDRPEQALLHITALAGKKIDSLVAEAADYMATAGGKVERIDRAEGNLMEARRLALSFKLDTFGIDAKLGQVRQASAQAKSPATPLPIVTTGYQAPAGNAVATDTVKPAQMPMGVGADMLAQARLELRSGRTEVARRLAEEAMRGNPGVKVEAAAILRDISNEEYNQRMLAAGRTFEAGVQAFNRRDYGGASSIFRTIDVQLLEPSKQARLKEIMQVPEMQPRNVQQASATGAAPGVPLSHNATDPGPVVGTQQTAPSPEAAFAAQVQALQDVRFQELRDASIHTRQQADDMFRAGDATGALDALQEFLGRLTLQVGGGQMNPDQVGLIRGQVETHLKRLKTLKAQQDFEAEQTHSKTGTEDVRTRMAMEHQAKMKQVSELMKKFTSAYEAAHYDEAEMAALHAKELDPENPIITAAVQMAKTRDRVRENKELKDAKEKMVYGGLKDGEDPGPFADGKNPEVFSPDFKERTKKRTALTDILIGTKTRAEQEIERKLNGHVSLRFENKPLGEVLKDLQDTQLVNIVADKQAMQESLININEPISQQLENIPLKSALNLILRDAKLTYVIRDDVIYVTTEKYSKGKLVSKVYQVTDLVIPILQANPADMMSLPAPGTRASDSKPMTMSLGGVQPYNPPNGLNSTGTQAGATGSMNSTGSMADSLRQGSQRKESIERGEVKDTMEDQLMNLIKSTIAPSSWGDMGGPGSLEYWPVTHSLVINQTPDIQEQIQDLLSALRRLQDQEVAVEIRFITVAESFYERLGIDFSVNILTPQRQNARYGPQLTTGNFQQGQLINNFRPTDFVSGLTPAGTFTSDLAIPIKSSSFALGIPPFGSFINDPGANGGLDLGLAFLSDIQVFLFMEAAQGDQRTHVMQAPKLTMFNGQTANITVADQQFFTSDLNVIIVGTQIAFAPTNTLFPTGGVSIFIRAAISGDRRFVRLDMTPRLFNLASAVVPLIPVVTPIFPATFEGGQPQNPVIFTQFIQQPTFNTITVSTSVAVPDGGTVLMGGLKRLSEGRNEFGPPVLSKIPYINRLFRNVGYGREVESLMMMVTPRIIIQEEEEERATGLGRERLSGQ